MIGFETLRERLLEYLRLRIRNGEWTERALARRAAISQPHMHNMLKGVRILNPEASDQILAKLGLSALDLLDSDELRRALYLRAKDATPATEVPVLLGRLGPGLPWPGELSPFERVSVPCLAVAHATDPIVARLGEDPAMVPFLNAGDLALLDTSEAARRCGDPEALFAVTRKGEVAVRWVRRGQSRTYLLSRETRDHPHRWEVLNGREAERELRARVIPVRSLFPQESVYDPFLPPRDRPREPVPRSVAS
jgi:AraC-like DNA-binding protein